MCRAARAYYEAVHTEKAFNLYNTPVLDFIKASQDEKSNATIAIMCSDSAYGNGLRLVLQNLSKHILVFSCKKRTWQEKAYALDCYRTSDKTARSAMEGR